MTDRRSTARGGAPPSVDAALTPGVVVSADGATELICADREQIGRAIAYFRTRERRPWLRWRRADGTLVRRTADALDGPDGPFA
jgi:hypothetical protein